MKPFIVLSLFTTLLVLSPIPASADNLNWTVWPGNKTPAEDEKVDQIQEDESSTDVLVEAGLDDSPIAPATTDDDEVLPDTYLASTDVPISPDDVLISPDDADVIAVAEVMVSEPEAPIDSEPTINANASEVLPEYETSGQVIDEPSTEPMSVAELPFDLHVPDDEVVPAGDVAVVAGNTADDVIRDVPTIDPQLVISPVPGDTPDADVNTSLAQDPATFESVDPISEGEAAEEADFAAIEAEVNSSLILGPVAIADDLADAADGAEAVAEDASGAASPVTTDAQSKQTGRYDEVMSEIIKADRIDDQDKSANADQAAPLLLEQVLELALTNNPEVAMALAREEQARWGVREAGSYRSPTVDMVVELGPERNRPATNSSDIDDITPGRNLNLRISKLLYDGGVSIAEEDRRRQIRRTTEIETRLVIEEVVTKAIKSYMEILQNQQAATVAEDFVAEMQRMVNQITQMQESGAASKIELDFAKSRLASARAQTGNSAAQLNDALSNLEFLTGDLPEFIAVAPIDVSTVAVDTLLNYVEAARNNNAEVLLNTSNKTALSLKIRGQQAGYSPILSLNFKTEALQDEGGNSDAHVTSEVKLKAEYFLIDGGVRKARIQRSKAQLMELEWDHERLVKDIDRRIKQSYNQITTNRLTLAATEDEIKANQELRRLNRQNLEIGDISILELIEVEERLFNSQATWHRISSEMMRNYYELLIGVGDLPAVLVQDYTSSRIAE